jgi:dihydroorotate dehydrogenase (NAD+) catalytic subunit
MWVSDLHASYATRSGPAVRAVALAQVGAVSAALNVPIVAMGGISSGRDAADMIRTGATLVAVGTESFRDPAAGSRIAAELSGELEPVSG